MTVVLASVCIIDPSSPLGHAVHLLHLALEALFHGPDLLQGLVPVWEVGGIQQGQPSLHVAQLSVQVLGLRLVDLRRSALARSTVDTVTL